VDFVCNEYDNKYHIFTTFKRILLIFDVIARLPLSINDVSIIPIMLMPHPSIDKYFFWGQVYHSLCVHDVVNLCIYGVFL